MYPLHLKVQHATTQQAGWQYYVVLVVVSLDRVKFVQERRAQLRGVHHPGHLVSAVRAAGADAVGGVADGGEAYAVLGAYATGTTLYSTFHSTNKKPVKLRTFWYLLMELIPF